MSTTLRKKSYYSETEAARALGITVDELRGLVRRHIAEKEDDLKNLPRASFQPSDLLLLKYLAPHLAAATTVGSPE